jgi:ketosteroid isomerase-like protein
MKIATLFVAGVVLMPAALADDAEDVKKAVLATYAALNNGDVEAYVRLVVPEGTLYGGNGSFLQERNNTTEALRANLQGMFDAGLKYDYRIRNLEVKVYGDSAVATGYVVGSRTAPDGVTRQVTLRRSMMWIRQGRAWKVVHVHSSPLTISTTRIEDRFVGTWKLVAFERRGPDGELRPSTNSFSNGLLVYTSTGHISQQLTREGRQTFSGRGSGEEAQEALYSYLAYFGTFTVNEGQGTVTHHRQAHLIPGRVTDGMRHYRFMGNRLMLTAPPGGEDVTTTLTWERIE